MVSLGRVEEIPVGNLRYLHGPNVNYNEAVVDLIASTPALRGASLSYWTRHAGANAFRLHDEWAGEGAFGPREQRGLIRSFAIWARVWSAFIFLQSVASGDDLGEAEFEHEAALLAGGRVMEDDHETMAHLPRNEELDAMIVAMHG